MKPSGLAKLAVFASGSGTNLQALLDACATGALAARVVLVVVNRPQAGALARAAAAGVPVFLSPWPALPNEKDSLDSRIAWERQLCAAVHQVEPQLLILAGWDRVLVGPMLDTYAGKIVNLHPALPGAHPGLGAIERARRAFAAGGPSVTGVMVHRVTKDLDAGPVVAQESLELVVGESLAELEARVHAVEHRLLVQAVAQELTVLADSTRGALAH